MLTSHKTRAMGSAILMAALCLPGGALARAPKKNKAERIMEPVGFGAATGRIGNSCFFFVANMTGGGFFTGLERLRTSEGIVLRKGPQLQKYYPEQIAVDIEGRAFECHTRVASATPPLNTWNFMKLLWFKAGWQKDSQVLPAEKLRYDTFEPVWWPPEQSRSWTYHLTMRTSGAPLTDDLLIVVLSDEGKEVVRIAGNVSTGYHTHSSLLFAGQTEKDNKDGRK